MCDHVQHLVAVRPRSAGCDECLKIGPGSMRLCLTCGHVGCCDSSPNRHATRHFRKVHHPVVASFEPGERGAWCYVDETELPVTPAFEPYLRD
jgi:uncharacterized UBP type Zn finger protein